MLKAQVKAKGTRLKAQVKAKGTRRKNERRDSKTNFEFWNYRFKLSRIK
jgi:hypothetical protein